MTFRITRRGLILAAACALPRVPRAETTLDLAWADLVPGGDDPLRQAIDDLGLRQAGELLGLADAFDWHAVTTAYNGRQVRIPGYMVPLAFRKDGVREFLLVPYVGACIHVPPPPPNQIVMVTAATPYPVTGYFDAIRVKGRLATERLETGLAEVGYVIEGAEVTPYG